MVVGNFDFSGAMFRPGEANSPLIIDSDAELSFPVAPQGFQAIGSREAKFIKRACVNQSPQSLFSPFPDVWRKPSDTLSFKG